MNTLKKLSMATAGVAFIAVGAITGLTDRANAFSIGFDSMKSQFFPGNYNYVYDLIGNGDSVESGDTLSISGLSGVAGYGTKGMSFNPIGFTSNSAQFQALDSFGTTEGNIGPTFTILSSVTTLGPVTFLDTRGGTTINSGQTLGPVSSTPVPEPSATVGLLTFGTLIGGSVLKRKLKQQKSAN